MCWSIYRWLRHLYVNIVSYISHSIHFLLEIFYRRNIKENGGLKLSWKFLLFASLCVRKAFVTSINWRHIKKMSYSYFKMLIVLSKIWFFARLFASGIMLIIHYYVISCKKLQWVHSINAHSFITFFTHVYDFSGLTSTKFYFNVFFSLV